MCNKVLVREQLTTQYTGRKFAQNELYSKIFNNNLLLIEDILQLYVLKLFNFGSFKNRSIIVNV